MSIINFPVLYINDPFQGRPLFNGQIYVGQPDLDPEVEGNQKQLNVVTENGTVIPVAQPFLLSAGGNPVYNGNTVRLDVDGDFSMKIIDNQGAQKYYIESIYEGQPVTAETLPDLLISYQSVDYVFDTTTAMGNSAISFDVNKRLSTKGLSSVDDGRGDDYIVKPSQAQGVGDILLADGKVAVIKQKQANQIVYSGTSSTILSENVQSAIDEVDAKVEPLIPSISENTAEITSNELRISQNETDITALQSGQTGGVIVFSTYALLDAYTPANAQEEVSSFKVTNDTTPSLNGYYSWVSGTTYIKESGTALGTVSFGDTEAVSGGTVFDYIDGNYDSSVDLFDFSANLFDKSNAITSGFFLDNTGAEVANANTSITYYIRLEPSTQYNYQGAKGTGTYGALYDKSFVFSRNTGSADTGSFTTSSNEHYFRCSVQIDDPALFMIQAGTTADLLTPYFKHFNADNQVTGWWDNLPEDAEVVLINTGQSNSVGAANKTTYEDSEVSENNIVKVWNNSTLAWDDQYLDITSGVVGWNAFMKDHAYKYNRQFKIINGGVSSTDIDYHLPGGLGYTNLVTYAQNAINDILTSGKRPYVYMLFIQGEADSNDSVDAAAYAAKQVTWIEQWKTNLGQNLPIIMGGINEFGANIADDIVVNNAKRRAYADGIISEFYEVTGFSTTDFLHRNRVGYISEASEIISKIDNIGSGLEITNSLPYSF